MGKPKLFKIWKNFKFSSRSLDFPNGSMLYVCLFLNENNCDLYLMHMGLEMTSNGPLGTTILNSPDCPDYLQGFNFNLSQGLSIGLQDNKA